jgi:hypothetical protein
VGPRRSTCPGAKLNYAARITKPGHAHQPLFKKTRTRNDRPDLPWLPEKSLQEGDLITHRPRSSPHQTGTSSGQGAGPRSISSLATPNIDRKLRRTSRIGKGVKAAC